MIESVMPSPCANICCLLMFHNFLPSSFSFVIPVLDKKLRHFKLLYPHFPQICETYYRYLFAGFSNSTPSGFGLSFSAVVLGVFGFFPASVFYPRYLDLDVQQQQADSVHKNPCPECLVLSSGRGERQRLCQDPNCLFKGWCYLLLSI